MNFDELTVRARAVLNPRRLSEFAEAGGVELCAFVLGNFQGASEGKAKLILDGDDDFAE